MSWPWHRRERLRGHDGPAPPTTDDVHVVYRELLGRDPLPAEVAHQIATSASVTALVQAIVASDEYAAHRTPSAAPVVVNRYDEQVARWTHPAGTRSDDGVAIVGHEGWLFLCGGANANLGQYVGEVEMAPGWLEEWRTLMERRRTEVDALGAQMATLVVPDKLPVYEEHYPEPLIKAGPRPVERLLSEAGGLPIAYPLEALRAAAREEPVFLRTDSHVARRGNAVLYDAVAEQVSAPASQSLDGAAPEEYVLSGDLGSRFAPQVVEIVSHAAGLGTASIVEDNRDEMAAVGGHIGTRRVFRNEAAPDARTVVVFGDSYGFATPNYQGTSWFLAQAFREVHFVWVPFGWDPAYAQRAGADVVLFETAERFAARVPRFSVDVDALVAETFARKAGLDTDSAFSD